MRIVYGYDEVLPTRGADSEQVLNTVAAVSRTGTEVELLTVRPRRAPLSEEELKAHYQVTGEFTIRQLWSPPLSHRVGVKLSHAAQVANHPRSRGAIVHTRNIATAVAAALRNREVLYETYRPWPQQYPPMRLLFERFLHRPNVLGIVLHSHHAAASYLALDVDPDKVAVIHNGYDPVRLEPRLDKREAREKLGLSPSTPIATYAGRVDPDKGLGVVLEMARRCPEVEFLIVGSRGEGPLETEGRTIPNLRFIGWQSYRETIPYLYSADVLLIPPSSSPLERAGSTVLPMKIFQYLATGRVVLAGATPDLVEILHHDENAVTVAPGDVGAAVTALRKVVGSSDYADRISAGALASARDLTWDARGLRIVELIQRRRGSRPARRGVG